MGKYVSSNVEASPDVFIWRPGAPADPKGNVFIEVLPDEIMAAMSLIEGPKHLIFDNEYQNHVFPAGTYDMEGVVWGNQVRGKFSNDNFVTCEEGCEFLMLRDFSGVADTSLSVVNEGTTTSPIADFPGGGTLSWLQGLDADGSLQFYSADGAAPLIDMTPTSPGPSFVLTAVGNVSGFGDNTLATSNPAVKVGANAFWIHFLNAGGGMHENVVTGVGFVIPRFIGAPLSSTPYGAASGFGRYSTVQPAFTGTWLAPDVLASNLKGPVVQTADDAVLDYNHYHVVDGDGAGSDTVKLPLSKYRGGHIIEVKNKGTLSMTIGLDATESGSGDSFALSGTEITHAFASGAFNASYIGKTIRIAGSTSPANDGDFVITGAPSATDLTWENAAGVTEAFPGTFDIYHETIDGSPVDYVVAGSNATIEFRSDNSNLSIPNWESK